MKKHIRDSINDYSEIYLHHCQNHNQYQCSSCSYSGNKDVCLRLKLLQQNEHAEITRAELNNKKRAEQKAPTRNTYSSIKYEEITVLCNYEQATNDLAVFFIYPYIPKSHYPAYYTTQDVLDFKPQVYKRSAAVKAFWNRLSPIQKQNCDTMICLYLPNPYATSFDKEAIDLYTKTLEYYFKPIDARLLNKDTGSYHVRHFNNWDELYEFLSSDNNNYKGTNNTKFIARMVDSSGCNYSRDKLTLFLNRYGSDKDCFSFTDVKAIKDNLSIKGINITDTQFHEILKKINTLSKKI